MDLTIEPAEDGVAEAARRACAVEGIAVRPDAAFDRGAWWQAGLADAIARAPEPQDADEPYDAARSPRRTRGATRA